MIYAALYDRTRARRTGEKQAIRSNTNGVAAATPFFQTHINPDFSF